MKISTFVIHDDDDFYNEVSDVYTTEVDDDD